MGCLEMGHPWVQDAVVGEVVGEDGKKKRMVYASCNMNVKTHSEEDNNYLIAYSYDPQYQDEDGYAYGYTEGSLQKVKEVAVGRQNHLYQITLLSSQQASLWTARFNK